MKRKGIQEESNGHGREGDNSPKKDFLVVGIGASAGGVAALRDFFSAMPSDSGMAFVVILHLSQEHKSSLAEIIQRETQMPVEQVTETVKVEPNKVYVIPPAKHLEMTDGVITPRDPVRRKGVRVPIDRFFRTLADAYGTKAVSIILSGTGTDGTLGMKHIKGRDGFAIVQDPLDAEYDGMPRSAIETKIVDVVLSVADMPERLLFVRDSSEKLKLTDGPDGEVANDIKNFDMLRDVLALLRIRTGHDFSNYKRPTIVRRIARHLQIHETDDLEKYLTILRDRPDEVLSLLKNLLINVTNFFRDTEAFSALEKKVIPALFEGKSGEDHVRVWIAGCATGEEAYSIAILLSEYAATLPEPPKIQVFASDVDDDVIAEAREGCFTEAVVSDVSPERLRLFFTKEEDMHRIRKQIREMILFAPHNILRDPPFSRLDLITCRNVLIYLNRDTQEKVLNIFHFALRAGGRLFLGSSESAESAGNLFFPLDTKHRIYRRRPETAPWMGPPEMPMTGVWKPRTTEAAAKSRTNPPSFGELHHQLIEQYAPPSVLIDEDGEILHISESAGRFLRFAGGTPTNNLMKVIDPALLPDVRAALFTARKEDKTVEARNIRLMLGGKEQLVNIAVCPVKTPDAAAIVIFEEAHGAPEPAESLQSIVSGDAAMEGVVRRMEDELRQTKDQLRNTIEQYETSTEELKASNEELQAINEELRSASEELETGKEELQSVNEELTTVNHELKDRIDEVAHMNSDLENLMRSTDIATIFLDRELQIKLYTPPSAELFNIIPADIGRPLEHITHTLSPDHFSIDAALVLKNLQPIEREVRSTSGRHFIARFLPYRGIDDRISGVVLTFIDITDRVLAREEQLRLLAEITAAQKHSDSILEQMPAGVIVANAEERFVFGNQKMAAILGEAGPGSRAGEEYRRWDLRDSSGRSLKPEEMPMARALRKGETVVNEEMHLWNPDAPTTVGSVNAAPLVGADGNIVGGVLAFEDISRRVNAETELRASEKRYRDLFNSIDEGFCIVELVFDENENTVDYKFLECSPSFEKQTGIEDPVGKSMRELRPDHEQYWFDTYGRIALTGEPERFENHAAAMDRWFDIYAFRFGNPEERQVAVLFNDITERKSVEDALRKSEEAMRRMAESFSDYAIFISDVEGRVLSWNTGAEEIFGYSDEEIVGTTCDKLYTPEDRENNVREMEMQAAREKGRAADERWHMRKDQSRFFASGVMAPIFDDSSLVGYAKIARDLTEAKKIEEELNRYRTQLERLVEDRTAELEASNVTLRQEIIDRERAEEGRVDLLRRIVTTQEEERSRIARDMHDQLGQQLTALRLQIATLAEYDSMSPRMAKGIQGLQGAAARLDAEVGFLAWELRPAALDDLGFVAATRNFVSEWSRHYGIPAELHAGNVEGRRLLADVETNLYRIVQEALNNVIKHAGASSVSIVVEKRRDDIVLVIEDDGKGFEAGELKPSGESGRGLGLIGMHERAALIGGAIEIESGPGKGTTIFVRVPKGVGSR
ncbi:MAG: chemotaxis protein CheB [Pyrinomonadaceae bacterium]